VAHVVADEKRNRVHQTPTEFLDRTDLLIRRNHRGDEFRPAGIEATLLPK
jgi:hypothetical protein